MLAMLLAAAAWGYGTPNFDGWPPVRYTKNNTAFVHFTDKKSIARGCLDDRDEACSFGPPNELYVPNPCKFDARDDYARLLCHEIGHLNGWPDNHPKE